MSYEDKLAAFRQALERYFDSLGINPDDEGDQKTYNITPISRYVFRLKATGALTEESLRSISYEDIQQILPTIGDTKPTVLVKEICQAFRKGADTESSQTDVSSAPYLSNSKVQQLPNRELIRLYSPSDPTNKVGERLKKISRDQPFLVFNDDGTVNVAASDTLLVYVTNGQNGVEVWRLPDGTPVKVYRVGYRPPTLINENPIYVGRALLGEYCDQLNRSWDGIPLEVRQFVRLIVLKEGAVNTDKAHKLLDLALQGTQVLHNRYADVVLDFNARRDNNTLPTLKIASDSASNRATSNPLADGQRVQLGRAR